MRNIKLFLFLILIVFIAFYGIAPVATHAQTQQQLLFAVTPYDPSQSLDFFFTHSVHKLAYYEQQNKNYPIKTPVFLSIITQDQKQEYIHAGYKPIIVDENAGDIKQYYVVYNRQANQSSLLADPVFKQQGLELVYPITEYSTLIKLVPAVAYHNLNIPGLHKFQARRFLRDLVPPTDKTSFYSKAIVSPSPLKTNKATNSESLIAAIVIVFLIAGLFFYKRRLKKRS
jgi:hypothetical protein